jgi:hypothetical protein
MGKKEYVRAIEKGGTGRFERSRSKSKSSRIGMDDLIRYFHELLGQVIIRSKIGLGTRPSKHNENQPPSSRWCFDPHLRHMLFTILIVCCRNLALRASLGVI